MKKIISCLLTLAIILGAMVPGLGVAVAAADSPSLTTEESGVPEGLVYEISDGEVTITDYTGRATELVIPATIEGCPVTSIGYKAFYFFPSLESIIIPEGVESIGSYAFYNCESLTSIILPSSLKSIDGWAFVCCKNLESIILPESLTSIGNQAFSHCSSLESITIPEGVTSISDSAFRLCSSLKSITLPESLTSIDSDAFYDCESLESIIIPKGVKSIGEYAFSWCTSLTSITIPDGVTTISKRVFYNCESLKSTIIPEGVTSISDGAFDFCTSLSTVYYEGSKAQWSNISIGSNNENLTNANIIYGGSGILSVEAVEKMEGTGANVAPALKLTGNPGLNEMSFVVVFEKAAFELSDADPFEGTLFSADDSAVSELKGAKLNAFVPEGASNDDYKAYRFEVMTAYDEDEDCNPDTFEDGVVAYLPLALVAPVAGESYNYTIVVESALNMDGDEVDVALDTITGTVNYVADPLIGIKDEFTLFFDPSEISVAPGTETVDVDVRIDANPGIWAIRCYIVYPEALKLVGEDYAAGTNGTVFADNAFGAGRVNLPLDDENQVKAFKDVIAAQGIETEGYVSSTFVWLPDDPLAEIDGNGLLMSLQFELPADAQHGDEYDIAIYTGAGDVFWAGTEDDGITPKFVDYTPAVEAATIVVNCEHGTTEDQHLDATCGADGYDRTVCSICGEVLSEDVIEATGDHTEGDPVVEESTCVTAGTSTIYCEVCGELLSTEDLGLAEHTPGAEADCKNAQTCTECGAEVVPALGHEEGEPDVTKATCTEDGSSVISCTRCGETLSEEVLTAPGHTYLQPNGTVITPPSCTEGGYTTKTCDVCGDQLVTDEVPAEGHIPGEAATCTTAQVCTVCNTGLAPATGHTPGAAATCTTAQVCTVCNTGLAPATGHTPGAAATCTTVQICTICNIELAPATGHTPDIPVVENATCTEDGYRLVYCADCGCMISCEMFYATGHTNLLPESTVIVDATCTTDGLETRYCDICHEIISVEGFPAYGHNTEGVEPIIVPSTCLVNGTSTIFCAVCNETVSVTELPIADHTPCNSIVVEPTCNKNGYVISECEICGYVWISENINKLPHTKEVGEIIPSTCVDDGLIKYVCSVCGIAMGEEIIPCGGHVYELEGSTIVIPPTCTEGGYTVKICDFCGSETVANPTDSKGHNEKTRVVIIAPTCTEYGYELEACTDCGDILVIFKVTATGHSYVQTVVPPTQTQKGYTAHVCMFCEDTYVDSYTDPIAPEAAGKGDLNEDGVVSASDLNMIKRYLAGQIVLSDDQLLAGDINKDSTITASDMNALLRIIAGLIS